MHATAPPRGIKGGFLGGVLYMYMFSNCLCGGEKKGKSWPGLFASFHHENNPNVVNFKVPTSLSEQEVSRLPLSLPAQGSPAAPT